MRGFITGLPRTRSYWLSQYFAGYENVLSYHELTNWCFTKEEFSMRMLPWTRKLTINCDSGLWITDWQTRFPDAKTVIIERDLLEAFHSCWEFLARKGFDVDGLQLMELLQKQKRVLDSVDVDLRVSFDDVDSALPEITRLMGLDYTPEYHQFATDERGRNMPTVQGNREAYILWTGSNEQNVSLLGESNA